MLPHALAACAVLVAACAGDGVGLDQAGRPLPPGGAPSGALTADFASIQEHVLTPICTVCHAGASAPEGLRLDAANSYALLVGVPSTEVPSILRAKPGDPDNSYLVQKLEGHASVGARMPFGGPYLDAATIAVIRQWISDGALRPAAAVPGGFTVSAVVPSAGEVLVESPARIVIEFGAELDQTRIDPSSLHLESLAPAAGTDGSAAPVPVELAVPAGDPRALIVTPRAPLGVGRYRIVVGAPPETGLAGIGGDRLGAGDAPSVVTFFDIARQP